MIICAHIEHLSRKLVITGIAIAVFYNFDALANPEVVVGSTVAIAEVSVLKEIQESAEQTDWQEMITSKDKWSGFASGKLPMAQKNRVRLHRPMYTLEHIISDHRGAVIYPKGYTFNPLAYVRLPSNILVVGDTPDYGHWLAQHAGSLDMVLTAGGDPMKLAELYNRPVFILEPKLRERLDVKVVPSIVRQQGDALQITESVLDHHDAPRTVKKVVQKDAS